MYYTVFVEDRITHEHVVVLDMASRSEASKIIRFLEQFNACDIYFIERTVN